MRDKQQICDAEHPFGQNRPQLVNSHRSLWRYIGKKLGRPIGEFSGDILASFVGLRTAFKLRLAIYRIRTKVLGVIGLDSSMWLGKKLEKELFKHVVWVNPNDISYVKKEGLVPYIQTGDWDLKRSEFQLHPTIVDLYVRDKNYKDTQQYRYMRMLIESGKKAYWCQDFGDIERYFEILINACDEIRQGCYRVQPLNNTDVNSTPNSRYPNEIIVSLGRDGEMIQESGGSHRLSAAKVFGIEKVPVVVIRKHYIYAKKTGKWGMV